MNMFIEKYIARAISWSAVGLLVLLPTIGTPEVFPIQAETSVKQFILPPNVPVTWSYKVTLIDSLGAEQSYGMASITLDYAEDFNFSHYFAERSDAPLDTVVTAGPYEIRMTIPEDVGFSQFWSDKDDRRRVWFENSQGLYSAVRLDSFDFWMIDRFVPTNPHVGIRWRTSPDAGSAVVSIDSADVDGLQIPSVTVDWIHHPAYRHTLQWAVGLGLLEVRDWVVKDWLLTGEILVYRMQTSKSFP